MYDSKEELIGLAFYHKLTVGDMYKSTLTCSLWTIASGFLDWKPTLGLVGSTLTYQCHRTLYLDEPFLLLSKKFNIKNQHIRTGKYQFKILYKDEIQYLNITNGAAIPPHFTGP